MTAHTIDSRVTRFRVVQMLIGALIGAFLGYLLTRAISHLGVNLKHVSPTDFAAFLLTVILLAVGIATFALSFHSKLAGQSMERNPDAPPATGKELNFNRLQSYVLLLAGLLLGAPLMSANSSFATRFAGWIFAGIVALFLLQSLLNLLIWRKADEFWRTIMGQTSIVSFWAVNACLFLLGSAEKLHLIPPFSLWDALLGMMVIYIFASSIVATRSLSR